MSRPQACTKRLQRAQKVQKILLLTGAEVIEMLFHGRGFAVALGRLDCLDQVRGTAVVQQEISAAPGAAQPSRSNKLLNLLRRKHGGAVLLGLLADHLSIVGSFAGPLPVLGCARHSVYLLPLCRPLSAAAAAFSAVMSA